MKTEKIICVYKITNPEGKIYVGATCDYLRRVNTYKRFDQVKPQVKLLPSLIKYGYFNHQFEIIERCSLELLDEKEKYWIEYYDSFYTGLNCTKGRGNLGVKISEKTRNALKAARSIPVHQYDLTGKYLASFSSATEAGEKLKISYADIRCQVTGLRVKKTVGGYIWSEKLQDRIEVNLSRSFRRRVQMLDSNLNIVATYDNAKHAAESTGINAANISRVCNGKRLTAGNCIWKFFDQGTKEQYERRKK